MNSVPFIGLGQKCLKNIITEQTTMIIYRNKIDTVKIFSWEIYILLELSDKDLANTSL